MSNTKKITAYDFATFCAELQQAVKEGYEVDLKTNENYPQIIGIVFTAGLQKQQSEELSVPAKEQAQEEKVVEVVEVVETPKPRTSIYKPKKV